jgi:hypothetical protein
LQRPGEATLSTAEALALLGGAKAAATPYGTGAKHDAEAEVEVSRL